MRVSIPQKEWQLVARLSGSLAPEAGSVFLRSDSESRRWVGSRHDVDWLALDRGDGDEIEIALPPALIWFAAELADRDGSCDLNLIREDLVTIESRNGQASFDIETEPAPHLVPWPEVASRSTVAIERLEHLLVACSRSAYLSGSDEDLIWLAAEDGQLATSPDQVNQMVTYRTAARCDGSSCVAIERLPLLALLSAVNRVDGTSETTIDFPLYLGDPVGIRGEGWGALVPTIDLSAQRWAEQLQAALGDTGCRVTHASPEVWHVQSHGRLIRVALHDGPPEVARLSVVMNRDVRPTEELRELINRANQTLTGVRLWHSDEGDLVAGADVLCRHLDTLGDTLSSLASQITGLDVLLPALA